MPHCCWPSLARWLFYMTAFICHAANVLPSTWVWSRLYCICAGPGMATETTQVAILKIGSFDQHYDIIFGDKREETYDQGWAGIPVPAHSQELKPLIPFPELWEWNFSFPSCSRISGMLFFYSLPVPELLEFFFLHCLPVPELWEWIFFIPFPFPNCGNGFF